jgi:hypothetical protein
MTYDRVRRCTMFFLAGTTEYFRTRSEYHNTVKNFLIVFDNISNSHCYLQNLQLSVEKNSWRRKTNPLIGISTSNFVNKKLNV